MADCEGVRLAKVAGTIDIAKLALSDDDKRHSVGSLPLFLKHSILLGIGLKFRRMRSSITVSISTAIDQQGDATREIARNIQSVAAGSSEINANIGGVTTAAAATGKAASEVLSNARELDNQSGMLRSAVDEFLAKVRAA